MIFLTYLKNNFTNNINKRTEIHSWFWGHQESHFDNAGNQSTQMFYTRKGGEKGRCDCAVMLVKKSNLNSGTKGIVLF